MLAKLIDQESKPEIHLLEKEVQTVCLEKADIRYKHWVKTVSSIALRKKDHEAFNGIFVTIGQPLEIAEGTFLLDYQEKRCKDLGEVIVRMYRVVNDAAVGNLAMIYQKVLKDRTNWEKTVRLDVKTILEIE